MNKKDIGIKLTDKDKNTILTNLKICTDSHGGGCVQQNKNENNKKLN